MGYRSPYNRPAGMFVADRLEWPMRVIRTVGAASPASRVVSLKD